MARVLLLRVLCGTLAILPAVRGFADETPMRGMWVYKTELVMISAEERESLFQFCRQRQITDLFWQVHFSSGTDNPSSLENEELIRVFLREAHRSSLRVHALTGDPSHARPEKHERLLSSAKALIEFNQRSAADTRFDGLHLDVEPHGLPDWKVADHGKKVELLAGFVALHYRISDYLRAADSSLILGTDVVFWLNKVNEDGSVVYPVKVRGVEKDPASHLLGLVDHLAIMSYRNTASGRNGIISLVGNTIKFADTTRAKVFVGVKMADMGLELETFHGRSEEEMMKVLAPVEETFRSNRSYAGLSFFHYEAFKVMPGSARMPAPVFRENQQRGENRSPEPLVNGPLVE